MNLQTTNILLDGYNLELPTGTGIKTYAISTIKALDMLDANVSVLFSRPTSKNQVFNEVLFFDNHTKWKKLAIIKATIISLTKLFNLAQKVELNGVVIQGKKDSWINLVKPFSLDSCYLAALMLKKLLRFTTNIYIDEPIDIWHATYPLPINIISRGQLVKKITTIHDLIPLRLPYVVPGDKYSFYQNVQGALEQSEVIITDSEHSKQDIIDIFHVNSDRIAVIYPPLSVDTTPVSEPEIASFLKRYKLQPQKYILWVGTIEPRKNLSRLIQSYTALDSDLPLVLVGKKGWQWEGELGNLQALFGKNWERKIKILDYVPESALKFLYSGAFCFVFPSLYEGFGLTVLEAMSYGCPVITSNVSSLPEVGGNAVLYVDPYNIEEMTSKIKTLLNDLALREKLVILGQQQAKLFNLENYSQNLYQVYAQALGKK